MIDGHGDDLFRYGDRIKVNFSTNIWQHADLAPLKSFLSGRLDFVDSYPPPAPFALEKFIADEEGIASDEVIVTAGATDAIYTIAAAFLSPEVRVGILSPTFSEYEDACRLFPNAGIEHSGSLEDLADRCSIVWLCNPNNPTGTIIPPEKLTDAVSSHPDVLFIADQAYARYCSIKLLSALKTTEFPNLIALHSLTKQCCVPGLRIGYASGAAPLLSRLRARRMPWSVNALAAEGARFLLQNPPEVPVDMLLKESRRMQQAIVSIGIQTTPSLTNFFLCRLPEGMLAAHLKQWLVESYAFLIRDASNFYGLSASHFRIAVQHPEENDALLNALKLWIGH